MNASVPWRWRFCVLLPIILVGTSVSILAQDELSDDELDALLEDDAALDAWLEEEFSGWDLSAYTRIGMGYSDNVLLATVNPQSGAYLRSDLELFLNRFPDGKGEFFSYITGTDIRYSGVEGANKEQLWLSDTEWTRYLTDRLNGTLVAQYVFFDQILDLSLTDRQVARQRIQYNGYGLGMEAEYDAGKSNLFSIGFMALQEDYAEVLGRNWRGTVELGWERPVWKGAKIQTELKAERRDHEDRVQRDQFGRSLEGLLILDRSAGSVDLTQSWGNSGAVDSSIVMKYLQVRDNGSGYFDYDQWGIDLSLSGEWNGLETSLTLGVDDSKFLLQKAERFGTILRTKTNFWGEFFIKKQLMKRISVYLLVEYEESRSNFIVDEYDALSGTVGFQLDIWGDP